MTEHDLFNIKLASSPNQADETNKDFYGRYNYPWPPAFFLSYPPGVAMKFLNQDLGYFKHDRIRGKVKIWVAGCGTNQALITALKFPEAEVLGTDLSKKSLDLCQKNANQIGVKNLKLEETSINNINYSDYFDYIICTGVIHHNANPGYTLEKISGSLKKDGILELMVYNYYHRLLTTACQKSVRGFYDSLKAVDLDFELSLVRELMKTVPEETLMGALLKTYADCPEEQVADTLLQPIEFSYTVESLNQLAVDCNLETLMPCLSQFDASKNLMTWNFDFKKSPIKEFYKHLDDIKRWQVSNLLLLNESPMLWFYFQRKNSSFKRKTEHMVCEDFLNSSFEKNTFQLEKYLVNSKLEYHKTDDVKFPATEKIEDLFAQKIFGKINPKYKIRDIFNALHIDLSFDRVNDLRLKLTSSARPCLSAIDV